MVLSANLWFHSLRPHYCVYHGRGAKELVHSSQAGKRDAYAIDVQCAEAIVRLKSYTGTENVNTSLVSARLRFTICLRSRHNFFMLFIITFA